MSYTRLVKAFSQNPRSAYPGRRCIAVDLENSDHNDIRLHPVERTHRAFRGAFRRIAGATRETCIADDPDIVTQVLYGEDLEPDWKRLVIVKEALHVFDPGGQPNKHARCREAADPCR